MCSPAIWGLKWLECGTQLGLTKGEQHQVNSEKERPDGPKHRTWGSAARRAGPRTGITADCDMVAVMGLKACLSSGGQ